MEPLDREDHAFETTADRNNAIRNAQKIKSNTLKLIKVFRKDEWLVKLTKEFKEIYTRQSGNEISAFLPQFEKMRQLWFIKLSTSVEDAVRMADQVELSNKRVKELQKQLDAKKDNLDKFKKESQEAKELARLEIDQLKNKKTELNSEKYTQVNNLGNEGQKRKDENQKSHETRMTQLNKLIEELNAELLQVKTENTAAEKALLTAYENADKTYRDALESYDADMRDKTKEREDFEADERDMQHQLEELKQQWAERVEEKHKREMLAKILRAKEEEKQKEIDTLNKAAEFLQAHYRGMMQRREHDKARKGKGKKRRGKK